MDKKTVFLIIVIVALSLVLGYVFGTRGKKTGSIAVREGSVSSQEVSPQERVTPPVEYNEVITHTKQLLQKNPNDAKALSSLGDAYFALQRFEDAIDAYKKAVKVDPNDIDSCNDLGLSLHYTNKSSDAIKYIDECIKTNPNFQRIWLTKGFILSVSGRLPEAKEAWETAFKIDPTSDVGRAAADFLAQNK